MNKRLMVIIMGAVAIAAGVVVNYLGDRLLHFTSPPPGLRLEVLQHNVVETFSPLWVLDLFLVPFIAGIVVSLVYGLGGKLLCYFVPIIVRSYSYYEMMNFERLSEFGTILPIPYWILVLIVAIEAAAFGGVFGEIIVKKTYGRRPSHLLYKQTSKNSPSDPER